MGEGAGRVFEVWTVIGRAGEKGRKVTTHPSLKWVAPRAHLGATANLEILWKLLAAVSICGVKVRGL